MTLGLAPTANIYMPTIGSPPDAGDTAKYPFGMNKRAHDLAHLVMVDYRQQRVVLEVDELLTRAAQFKADDMQVRNFFAHVDPDGVSPNELARVFGVGLPDWYPEKGNNIESIAGNQQTAIEVVEAVDKSPGHADQVFGRVDFFRNQAKLGCGYCENRTSGQLHSTVWVILTAP